MTIRTLLRQRLRSCCCGCWFSIITLSAVMNLFLCLYIVVYVDWEELYTRINMGVSLLESFHDSLYEFTKIIPIMAQIKRTAADLNATMFQVQTRLGTPM